MNRLKKAMKKLQKGDMRSFDIIYDETRKSVFYTILQILNDRDISDDIMQDAYITVVNKIGQYDSNKDPRNWIITIAKNLAINEYNRRKKLIYVDCVEDEQLLGGEIDNNEIDTPIFNLARRTLKKDEFDILFMIIVKELKRKEIAKMLNIPISTVTWKFNEAIKKVRKEYEKEVASYE